jgi:hypothetical protein
MKMSKQNNVNPDYYKLAGRERQGEGIVQDLQKQTFAEQQAETERWQERQSGPPPWKATPPSTSVEPEPKSKQRRRARASKKTAPRPGARRKVQSVSRTRRAGKSSRTSNRRAVKVRARSRKRA